MRKRRLFTSIALVLFAAMIARPQNGPYDVKRSFLNNEDVVQMVKSGMKTEAIVAKIKRSQCHFDVFPSMQKELRMRGVPEDVLQAMLSAPSGPPSIRGLEQNPPKRKIETTIPVGTTINVEAAYTVSSKTLKNGDPITFLVTRPVLVDGIVVIARNAVATGRVVEVKKARAMGRSGMLAWKMEDVVAVDGTRIPVVVSGGSAGKNRVPTIVAGAAITAAIVFPYTSPVALVWAFKKGDEAVLFGSQSFSAVVRSESTVASVSFEKEFRPPYATSLKAKSISFFASPLPSSGNGFLPSGSFLPGGSFLPSVSFRPQ